MASLYPGRCRLPPRLDRRRPVMALQEGMEEAVVAENITWKKAVRVLCQMEDDDTGVEELVSMEEQEEAQEDYAPLLQTILANRSQMKLKRGALKIRGFGGCTGFESGSFTSCRLDGICALVE